MDILRPSTRGVVKTILLIIIIVLVLFYLGVDVNSFIETVGSFFQVILDLIIKFVKAIAEVVTNAIS